GFGQEDDVFCLVAPETDGTDIVADFFLAERQHFLRRIGNGKEPPRRLVDACVGSLRRKNDGDKKRECIHMLKLALRLGSLDGETAEYLMNFIRRIKRAPHPALGTGGRCVHGRFDFGLFHSASIMVSLSTKQSAA